MTFLGGKPVGIGLGLWAAEGQRVPVGIVEIPSDHRLLAVEEAGHVAIAIGIIVRMGVRGVTRH